MSILAYYRRKFFSSMLINKPQPAAALLFIFVWKSGINIFCMTVLVYFRCSFVSRKEYEGKERISYILQQDSLSNGVHTCFYPSIAERKSVSSIRSSSLSKVSFTCASCKTTNRMRIITDFVLILTIGELYLVVNR